MKPAARVVVPPPPETTTSAGPAAPAGMATLIFDPSAETPRIAAPWPPIVTPVVPVNPAPRISTVPPPRVLPAVGLILVMDWLEALPVGSTIRQVRTTKKRIRGNRSRGLLLCCIFGLHLKQVVVRASLPAPQQRQLRCSSLLKSANLCTLEAELL